MPGGDLMAFLPMIAIFVVFYFLLIRPQQKRAKEHKAMLEALQKGDEVVTAGGIVGRVAKLDRPVRGRRDRAERRDQRPARRDRAAAAQGHDQGAVTATSRERRRARRRRRAAHRRRPHPPAPTPSPAARHEPLSALEVHRDRRRAGRSASLYTLPNFFPRSAGGAGVRRKRDGEDRHRAARRRSRTRSRPANIPYPRRVARRDRRQGPLRRPRHAAQGARTCCRRSSATTTSSR